MPTSSSDIWNTLLTAIPRDEWIEIDLIYQLFEGSVDLRDDDLLPSAPGNDDPTWHRNVRNVLQRRKTSDILWGHRGLYYFPTAIADRKSLLIAERSLRLNWWQKIINSGGPDRLTPATIRQIGIYRGAQGIWVDKERTAHLSNDGTGIAVSLLHTDSQYPDELDEDSLLYHYPKTNRPDTRDQNEIQAAKNARLNEVPLFVIVRPTPASSIRNLRFAWVEDWNDSTGEFLISFGQDPPIIRHRNDIYEETFVLTASHITTTATQTMRTSQSRFRFSVFRRYGACCAVCSINIPELLDAVHIRPFSQNGTDDPRNGLVLCANHHRAFDAGLFTIDPSSLSISTKHDNSLFMALGITKDNLNHLKAIPHTLALAWHKELHI